MSKFRIVFFCVTLLLASLLTSCSQFDTILGSGLTGKWNLVEVQNGPAGFCKDGFVTPYPSGSVIIELTKNGKIVFSFDNGRTETHDYSIPENQEFYASVNPVLFIGDVPFGYAIKKNRLMLHYYGIATCDPIPATFVFKRKR